jgi:hypothetical protein
MRKLFAFLLLLPALALGETKVHTSIVSATGTPSSTTFLRGDGAWAEPSASSNAAWITTAPLNSTTTYAEATDLRVTLPLAGNYTVEVALDTSTASFTTAAQTKVTLNGAVEVAHGDAVTYTSAEAPLSAHFHAAFAGGSDALLAELLPTTKTDRFSSPAVYRITVFGAEAGTVLKVWFRTSLAGSEARLWEGSVVRWTRHP